MFIFVLGEPILLSLRLLPMCIKYHKPAIKLYGNPHVEYFCCWKHVKSRELIFNQPFPSIFPWLFPSVFPRRQVEVSGISVPGFLRVVPFTVIAGGHGGPWEAEKTQGFSGGLVAMFYFPINIGFMSSSPLTNSYFSEGWLNQPPNQHLFRLNPPSFQVKSHHPHLFRGCFDIFRWVNQPPEKMMIHCESMGLNSDPMVHQLVFTTHWLTNSLLIQCWSLLIQFMVKMNIYQQPLLIHC